VPELLDSRGATEADRSASAGSLLFETKLRGYCPSSEMLPRPRLSQSLEESRPGLVLLAAPPGFGKTTLLGQWRELDQRPFAWLTADSSDNDPFVFWAGVVAAIRQVKRSFGGAAEIALRSSRGKVLDALVPLIVHELESIKGEIVLVIDDYQVIANQACHESLAFFLEWKPNDVEVAISTRSDPPIPISKLRAAGELLEFRAVELCFTAEEEATFLNDALRLELTPKTLGILHGRTEGWPAGVYLASLSLRNASDPVAFVDGFGGSNRHVVDYLTEVVLTILDTAQREFLIETSILETMCAPLCDAVTAHGGSAEMLAELERANLFLIPLDDHREWYRYHPLFGGLLQDRLAEREVGAAQELHRRASAWLADAGYTEEAVRHAIAAGEMEAVTNLVIERWLSHPLVHLGRGEDVIQWLEPIPSRAFQDDPRLALVEAWAMSMLHRREEAAGALEVVETIGPKRALPDGSSVEAVVSLLRACFPWDDVGQAVQAAKETRELESALSPWWQPALLLATGWANYLAGQPENAQRPLEQAALFGARLHQWLIVSAAQGIRARIALAADELEEAEVWASEAVHTIEVRGLSDEPGSGIAYVALGAVRARQRLINQAAELIECGLVRLRARGEQLAMADAFLVLAPVRRALATLAEARGLVEDARALIERSADPGMLYERLEEVARTLTPAHRRIEGDSELTEREVEVLRYLAEGLPKRDIGKVLFLSYNTIHSHTKSIYQKLRVSSRQAAIERARELGAL
jgi:LuxR family transcriptional regulator, maltose regulon positive regulatory protein